MKEKIYTIPVNDGFSEGGECPFCNMFDKLEKDSIEYMLGPSYMEGDIRMDTNAIGFCSNHYKAMFEMQNRLGLALMVHTHIQQIVKDFDKLGELKNATNGAKKTFFGKQETTDKSEISKYIENITDSCYICNRVNNVFLRYIDTFFYLWTKGEDMKNLLINSKGFCLEHYNLLLEVGEKMLKKDEYKEFYSIIMPIQLENLKRLEDELDWFIKKFDYRFSDEPWKNSIDSLQRAIKKLSSISVE